MTSPDVQVFEGVRILEQSTFIWGEFATKQFADFGADVIKAEPVGVGSPTRYWQPRHGTGSPGRPRIPTRSAGPLFLHLNANKCSTGSTSDATPTAISVRLVRGCDAVVEDVGPGHLERLKLGPDVLHELNPRLTLTRLSPFEQTGPYRDRPATGPVIQAMGGPMKATGAAARGPLRKPGDLEHCTIGRAASRCLSTSLMRSESTPATWDAPRGARAVRQLPPGRAGTPRTLIDLGAPSHQPGALWPHLCARRRFGTEPDRRVWMAPRSCSSRSSRSWPGRSGGGGSSGPSGGASPRADAALGTVRA